jgi:hypothetical protein
MNVNWDMATLVTNPGHDRPQEVIVQSDDGAPDPVVQVSTSENFFDQLLS